MYKALFEKKLISELAKEINKKTENKVESPEEVFDKLDFIYEEVEEREFGQPTGKKVKYMPKRWKEVLMRLLAPNYAISTRVDWHDEFVVAESFLYLDRSDAKPVCSGKSYCYFSSLDSSLSPEEKRSSAEMMARGLAESKAFQKYGIGAWFSTGFSLEDNPTPESIQKAEKNHALEPKIATVPVPVTAPAPKETPSSSASPHKEEAQAEQQVLPFMEPEPSPAPVSTVPEETSLLDAFQMKADIGKAASRGLTLGEVTEMFPINLVWMYTHGCSEEVANAIQRIAMAKPAIKALFDERSVPL